MHLLRRGILFEYARINGMREVFCGKLFNSGSSSVLRMSFRLLPGKFRSYRMFHVHHRYLLHKWVPELPELCSWDIPARDRLGELHRVRGGPLLGLP